MPFPSSILTPYLQPALECRTVLDFPECVSIKDGRLHAANRDDDVDELMVTRFSRYCSIYDYRCNFVLPDILEEEEDSFIHSQEEILTLMPNVVDDVEGETEDPSTARQNNHTLVTLRRYVDAVPPPGRSFLEHPYFAFIAAALLSCLEPLKRSVWKKRLLPLRGDPCCPETSRV